MAKIEIYTWDSCPFCQQALALLDAKNVAYQQYRIDGDDGARSPMIARTGGPKSVPQRFIDDQHDGGVADLYVLEERGDWGGVGGS